jgi:predicted nucleic acid-binding protein
MSDIVYIDTSAVLRAVLEHGMSPEVERRLGAARYLITSRLSLVESARALSRLRISGQPEKLLADAAREIDSVWARCTIWELTPALCELASQVAPHQPLRTLDALHLATWVLARRRLGEVDLLTADDRLERASRSV